MREAVWYPAAGLAPGSIPEFKQQLAATASGAGAAMLPAAKFAESPGRAGRRREW